MNGPIENGIRNSGAIRAIVNSATGEREFLVFVSSQERGGPQNPWEDVINREEGIVRYWGDAKARDNPNPENANGNRWVKNDYCETYAQDARADAPPVLLFEKPRSGEVTTSHYAKQAKEENLSAYPIRLFSGGDIVKLLAQTELVNDRRLTDSVVRDIEKAVGLAK